MSDKITSDSNYQTQKEISKVEFLIYFTYHLIFMWDFPKRMKITNNSEMYFLFCFVLLSLSLFLFILLCFRVFTDTFSKFINKISNFPLMVRVVYKSRLKLKTAKNDNPETCIPGSWELVYNKPIFLTICIFWWTDQDFDQEFARFDTLTITFNFKEWHKE